MKKIVPVAAALLMALGTAEAKNPHGDLPPGLQKKVEQGGELPPGWQKKLVKGQVLDWDLYEYGKVYSYGDDYERVYIEDKIVTVIRNTREIIEILDL